MTINMKKIKDNENAVYPNLLESMNIYFFQRQMHNFKYFHS